MPPATVQRPLTLLAFDLGQRRTGVAMGQLPGPVTRALTTLASRNGTPDPEALDRLLAEWQPQRLVVGLPYNMDGTPSPMCHLARRFASELEQRYGLPVALVDERLSSHSARTGLAAQRRAGERRRVRSGDVDREAARLLAEQWIATHDPSED